MLFQLSDCSRFEVFFWVFIEDKFASWSTEVVCFPLVDAFVLRGFLVNCHFANWVNSQTIHLPLVCCSNFGLNLFRSDALVTTDTELVAIAAAAKIGSSRIPRG